MRLMNPFQRLVPHTCSGRRPIGTSTGTYDRDVTTTIRPAGPGDARVLGDLAAATFPLACPPHATPEAIAEFIRTHLTDTRFADYLADPARIILLAERDGAAVGYTMLIGGDPTDDDVRAAVTIVPTIELSKVYTRQDAHGDGVAAPLMAETLARAADTGVQGIWLGVNQENARAIRFYQKQGFSIVGPKTFWVGPQLHHDYVMERALDA